MSESIEIPYYEIPPTYEFFLENHLKTNQPAIIGPELTKNWPCRKDWVVPCITNTIGEEQGPLFKPNYSYLRERFGTAEGQIARCNKRHFTDQVRVPMTFKEFADLWEADDGKESLYYLKDCHLIKTFPNDKFYEVPDIFKDDWLNNYWNTLKDDYKFSYMGGHTTFTTLHADVYRSYSWSSNICGIKKWTFFPPGQEHLFKDKFGNMVYDIRRVDEKEFTRFKETKRIIVYQKDGETVFVPSGWFHQVENIGPAISINHNWFNSTNLMYTYLSLKNDLNDCTRAISDIKDEMSAIDFTIECQNLLHVHAGWNWNVFLNILNHHLLSLVPTDHQQYQPDAAYQKSQLSQVVHQWISDETNQVLISYFTAISKEDENMLSKYNRLLEYIK